VLATGLGGNASFWAGLVPRFAQHRTVLTYDHRGSGGTTMWSGEYSVELLAADLIDLAESLGFDRFDLVGHSLGGAIAQVIALEHASKLRRLVISSSWTKADAYYRRLFEVRSEILLKSGVAPYFRAGSIFLYPPEYFARNREAIEKAEAGQVRSAPPLEIMLAKIEALMRFDRTAELAHIGVPTLVNCAKDDVVTPFYFSQELAAFIPQAMLRSLEYGGHFCHVTAADEYYRQLADFLLER
jgi:aminoacrylate hydrolase